jgi:acyl-CoA thioesterase FadM
MTVTISSVPATVLTGRPGFEGANIRTWIGFKHFMYLVEEAVLGWFRERGLGPQRLYHEHGLGLEIVDSSVQLPALLEVDDEVVAEVAEERPGRFSVALRTERGEGDVLVAKGTVVVALVREAGVPVAEPPPEELAALVVPAIGAGGDDHPPEPGSGTFVWTWRARYFHCHFSDRVQHSAYVRALEEVVERFLDARGLSIRTVLAERGWIPVVSRARVRLVGDARMEETIHTGFTVGEILKDMAYDARMDCWAERDGGLVRVATATILHGYAASRGADAGRLVELDPETRARLRGGDAT